MSNQNDPRVPFLEKQVESFRKIILSASLENGVLKQKLKSAHQKISRLESIEFAESDLKAILKAQKSLHEEIRRKRPESSVQEPSDIERKLLQLQLMLPEIVRGWQSKRVINTSVGVQATVQTRNEITSTADDKKGGTHQAVTIDRTERIPDEVWKTLSIHRRMRIWKKDALKRAYNPENPPPLFTTDALASETVATYSGMTSSPISMKAKLVVQEGSVPMCRKSR